jgi:DNA-binding HxlR family transcriptional regulator
LENNQEWRALIGDITQRALMQTLRNLERDGYVARNYPTSPPTVEYWLTPLGKSLLKLMGNLVAWANARFAQALESRGTNGTEEKKLNPGENSAGMRDDLLRGTGAAIEREGLAIELLLNNRLTTAAVSDSF